MALYNRMQEADITPSQKFLANLSSILKANNISNELSELVDKQAQITNKWWIWVNKF